MEEILVSVIIPFYNNDETIRGAVQSVIEQTICHDAAGFGSDRTDAAGFGSDRTDAAASVSDGSVIKRNIEIIIVDASLSLNREYLKGLGKLLPIRIVKKNRKIDAAIARNLGVRAARGEYVAFLDADDWWEKDKLSSAISLFKEKKDDRELKLVFTARRLCKEDGEKTEKVINAPQKVTYKELLKSNYISRSSVVMKKDTAMNCPMRSGNIHEDYLCWLELFKDGGYAAGIDKPYLNYRSYRSSRSGSKFGSAVMTYRTYKRAGFGFVKRMGCMMRYTVNGMKKYKIV